MKKLFRTYTLLPIVGILLIPLTWYLVADVTQLISPLLLSPLQDVVARLIETIGSGELLIDLGATIARWLAGFCLGVVSGVSVGLILGLYPLLRSTFELPLEFFRALPVTALFPLFLVIFGLGDQSKIAMAFFPTFLLMIINSCYGVAHSTPERRLMARAFGATPWQVFFKIVSYEALPQIMVGLRLAATLSLTVTVVSEMFIGTDMGLGQKVYDAYLTSSMPTLYGVIVILGLLGYFVNKFLIFIERRFVFWAGR